MKTIFYYPGMILVFLVLSCCTAEKKVAAPTPEKANQIRNAVTAWMECEECENKELNNVTEQGEVVVPTLIAILKEGPSAAKKEELILHLNKSWDDLVAYQKTHPEVKVSQGKEEYVKTYLDNYIALYQTRAAIALGTFKSSKEAKNALQNASTDKALRADVVEVVKKALE